MKKYNSLNFRFLISGMIVMTSAVGYILAQKRDGDPKMSVIDMRNDQTNARQEIAKSVSGSLVLDTITVKEPDWTLVRGSHPVRVRGESSQQTALSFRIQIKFASASSEVEITVTVPKTEFRLGEIVPVDIGVKNTTNTPLEASLSPCIKVTSKKDNSYKLYAPPRNSFTLDGYEAPLVLRPQETQWTQESIFWNYKPQVSHLNEEAAKPEIRDRILSDYAFSESGEYLIKGCTAVISNKKWKVVDSEPIEITITDPVDEDLEVWSLLKRNANIGYFLQVGDVPRTIQNKTEERDALLREIDSILEKYPNNLYSVPLRKSRDKFHSNEVQRQEFMRKMKRPNN